MAFRPNPAGLASLRDRLTAVALKGAEAAVEVSRDKLSGPGSGRQYAGLPNRSSAPHEYPAEQTGDLLRSMDARAEGEGRAVFGPINSPPPEAGYLHFSSAADIVGLHFRPPDDGGRPFMDDLLHDRDVQNAVKRAVGAK